MVELGAFMVWRDGVLKILPNHSCKKRGVNDWVHYGDFCSNMVIYWSLNSSNTSFCELDLNSISDSEHIQIAPGKLRVYWKPYSRVGHGYLILRSQHRAVKKDQSVVARANTLRSAPQRRTRYLSLSSHRSLSEWKYKAQRLWTFNTSSDVVLIAPYVPASV